MKFFVIVFLFIGLSAHGDHNPGEPAVKHSLEAALENFEDLFISRIEDLYSTSRHYNKDNIAAADLKSMMEDLALLQQVRSAIHFNQCKGPSFGIAVNVNGKVQYKHLDSGEVSNSFSQGMHIFSVSEKGTRITVSKDASLHIANLGGGTLKLKDPKSASTVSYAKGKSVSVTNGEIDLFFE